MSKLIMIGVAWVLYWMEPSQFDLAFAEGVTAGILMATFLD